LVGIPGIAYLLHDAQINRTKDQGHLFLLFYANSMFTGDGATYFGTDGEYLVSGLAHALNLARNKRIEENKRMQVTITGMKAIAYAQAIALTDFAHAP